MTREYQVVVENNIHTIMVSDSREILLKAKAAGKTVIGLWKKDMEQDLDRTVVPYLVESIEGLTEGYLEQIVRRNLGLPWIIAETRRLIIREFQMGDERQVPREGEDKEADKIFQTSGLLKDYIQYQYGFYEYGIWAVVEKESGRIIGKCGVTNLDWEVKTEDIKDGVELGYHIFLPYRQKGYGREACQAILSWCQEHLDCPIYAKIDTSNEASVRLAKSLGFCLIDRTYSESGQWCGLYGWVGGRLFLYS